METAVDFLGALRTQLNAGKLDPRDVSTKNKIALFVGLLAKVRRFKEGKIGKDEMLAAIRNVTASGGQSNTDLDIANEVGENDEERKLRDEIIASLTVSPDDTPDVVDRKRARKVRFMKALDSMQRSFYQSISPALAQKKR
jgi:hypothetical protein